MTVKGIIRRVLSVSVVLTVLAACSGPGSFSPEEHVKRAKDFQSNGDLRSSIIELKNALQQSPDNVEARWLLGQIYVEVGLGNDAEKELLRAQQLGVSEEAITEYMGQALLLQKQYERVLKEIKPQSQKSPRKIAQIYQYHGDAALGLRDFEKGCAAYKQSKETDATNVPTYWGLARCAAANNELSAAKSFLDEAIKLDAKNATTWVWLGGLERTRNDAKAAESAFLTATKLAPENVDALLSLASLNLALNKTEAAEAGIDSVEKIAPSHLRAKYLRALLHFKRGKYAEARENLQQVLRVAPDHMPSILLAGATGYLLGSYEQASQDLGKVLVTYPNSAYARKLLASTWLKAGQPARAVETLKPLLASTSEDASVFGLAGEAALEARDPEGARKYLQRAVAIDPKKAPLRAALGVSYMAGGDSERAMAELEVVASQEPEHESADTVLILSHLQNNAYDKALAAINVLEKKKPNNPAVHNYRGAAYAGKGDLVNARKSFEQALTLDPAYVQAAANLAKLDLRDKMPEMAKKRYESVLTKDEKNVQAMLALADLASNEDGAVAWWEKAAKTAPSALDPRRLLVAYYLRKGETQKALTTARDAQRANPNSADALDLLGSAQMAAKESQNAIATFGNLVKLAPLNPITHFKLASAEASAGHDESARASLRKALELKPDFVDANQSLVLLELKANKPSEALNIAAGVQKKFPKSAVGFVLEGDIWATQKQYAKAAKVYEQALVLGKNGVLSIKLHQTRMLSGNAKEADAGLVKWLKDQPKDTTTRTYLAQSFMDRELNAQAIEQYQILLKNDPDSVFALNNLAWVYHKAKDPRALATAERAYKLSPDAAFVADSLGWILHEQGASDRALEVLRKAASLAPTNAEIGYHYAVVLSKSGDKTGARKQLEAILTAHKEFAQLKEAKALLTQLGG